MKSKSPQASTACTPLLPRAGRCNRRLLILVVLLVSSGFSAASLLADDAWTGGGTDLLWSNGNNWSGGRPDTAPYGTLYFNDTANGKYTNTDTIGSLNESGLSWSGTKTWTINTSSASNVINFYDNGGTQSKIENYSTGAVTINVGINFAQTATTNPFAEINAVNGDLDFGGLVTVSGSGVNGVKLYGGTARITTFSGGVTAGTTYVDLIGPVSSGKGTGTKMVIAGALTSGDIYVGNGSTLNYATGASFTEGGGATNTYGVRLGGDSLGGGSSISGFQDLTKGATFALTPAAGGLTFAGVINSVTGNTSGALLVDSQNTSGTNTLGGHIALDSALTIQESGAGTLAITQARSGTTTNTGSDIKGQTLTFNVATGGTIADSGTIYNSTGSGGVNKIGSGSLTLSNANTYTGPTSINGGTLQLGNGGTTGMLSTSSSILIASGAALAFNRTNAVTQGTDFSSAAITGAGGVTQAGSNTLTLSAANSYTGPTAVNAGTLLVNGSVSSTTGGVSVASGATLGGGTTATPGTIGGATTINAGGTITGATNGPTGTAGAIGTLSFANALTINGTYVADISSSSPNSDLLKLTAADTTNGKLTIGAGSTLTIQGNAVPSTAPNSTVYVLATYASIMGTFTNFNIPAGYALVYGTKELDLAAIPEPGTWAGGLLLVGTFGFSHRRRLRAWHSLGKSA